MYQPDLNRDRATELAFDMLAERQRIINLRPRPSVYSAMAQRFGRVAVDYKPCGVAQREEGE